METSNATTDDLENLKADLLLEIKKLFLIETEKREKVWIKTPELKEWLNLSHGTVQQLRINGTFPYTKIGGVIYYNKIEIEQIFIEKKIHNK